MPTSLQTPNAASVRFRLPTGLTLEPQFVLSTSSTDLMAGGSNKQRELTLGAAGRYPIVHRDRIDLEAIGDASLSVRATDPNGDNNNRTVTTIGLGYGAALAYWMSAHWCLSLTATNPLIEFARTRQETAVTGEVSTSASTIGLVWSPQVSVMIHLYD